MTECPSRAAERFQADQEFPEECPVCGKPNADEQGVFVFDADPAFCSAACRDGYVVAQRAVDDVAASIILETEQLIRAHNARCPQCCHSSKYCPHEPS